MNPKFDYLRELYLDENHLYGSESWDELHDPNKFIILHDMKDKLVCLSIRNVKVHRCEKPLPQQVIMNFVRNAPKLRWLRSDLTKENVAILQKERPEVIFCS